MMISFATSINYSVKGEYCFGNNRTKEERTKNEQTETCGQVKRIVIDNKTHFIYCIRFAFVLHSKHSYMACDIVGVSCSANKLL